MKSRIVVIISICVLLISSSAVHSATSAIDNLPGGAGLAYWQAGGGWDTLINIQEVGNECALIMAHVYNRDGNLIFGYTFSLIPMDNMGIIIQGDGTDIMVYDSSDTAYGGSPVLNDFSTGPALVFAAPADSDGLQRGYVSFVRTNIDCSGPGGSPAGNITAIDAYVPDNLFVRSAIINPNNAIAINGIMLQGFANIPGNIDEEFDFTDVTPASNPLNRACDFNNDGDTTDSFLSVDDLNGAGIDFAELFLSENVTTTPDVICNTPGYTFYKAVGASDNYYCCRYNENPAVGSETILVVVAPQSSHASATRFSRNMAFYVYDDDSLVLSTMHNFAPAAVAGVPFGPLGIMHPSTSGEACFTVTAPIFGFTFTEAGSFADLYSLIRRQIAVTTLNKDGIDDTVDLITLP